MKSDILTLSLPMYPYPHPLKTSEDDKVLGTNDKMNFLLRKSNHIRELLEESWYLLHTSYATSPGLFKYIY